MSIYFILHLFATEGNLCLKIVESYTNSNKNRLNADNIFKFVPALRLQLRLDIAANDSHEILSLSFPQINKEICSLQS